MVGRGGGVGVGVGSREAVSVKPDMGRDAACARMTDEGVVGRKMDLGVDGRSKAEVGRLNWVGVHIGESASAACRDTGVLGTGPCAEEPGVGACSKRGVGGAEETSTAKWTQPSS